MKVFKRIESETSDGGRIGERSQQLGQSIRDVLVRARTINSNSHVLLWIPKQGELGCAIGG